MKSHHKRAKQITTRTHIASHQKRDVTVPNVAPLAQDGHSLGQTAGRADLDQTQTSSAGIWQDGVSRWPKTREERQERQESGEDMLAGRAGSGEFRGIEAECIAGVGARMENRAALGDAWVVGAIMFRVSSAWLRGSCRVSWLYTMAFTMALCLK